MTIQRENQSEPKKRIHTKEVIAIREPAVRTVLHTWSLEAAELKDREEETEETTIGANDEEDQRIGSVSFLSFYLSSFTFFISVISAHIIFQGSDRGQQRAGKLENRSAMRGLEFVTFIFKRRNLIRLTTAIGDQCSNQWATMLLECVTQKRTHSRILAFAGCHFRTIFDFLLCEFFLLSTSGTEIGS